MASLLLTTLKKYREYFQGLATGANHHKEIDGYKWGDEDVVQNDNRSDMPERILWAQPYDNSRYTDRNSDNIVKTKGARVAYLKPAASEAFSDIETCVDECEAVMEQILAKMLMDKRGYDVAGVWTMISFDVNGITGQPIEYMLGSTQYYGFELYIPFIDNTNMAYDASKWL